MNNVYTVVRYILYNEVCTTFTVLRQRRSEQCDVRCTQDAVPVSEWMRQSNVPTADGLEHTSGVCAFN